MIFRRTTATDISSDVTRLLDDLRGLFLTKEKEITPAFKRLRQQLEENFNKVREATSDAVEHSKTKAKGADDYAHESPWKTAGGALAVGALIGFMLSKR